MNNLFFFFFFFLLLFNDISTLVVYLMPKPSLVEEQLWYYLTHCWRADEVHAFSKGICPKVNLLMLLKSEPAYYDIKVLHLEHAMEK